MRNKYMEQALDVAFSHIALTSPNPAVGAIIVKDNEIVGRGGTSEFGLSHAEVVAITDAGDKTVGSEIYVTLEPCNHYGKTPPCTEAIIAAGIKKVYIAIVDPNPKVAGKGIAKLQSKGIEVVMLSQYEAFAFDLIRPFKKFIEDQKPFVIHKYASTLNGSTATDSGDSKWISSNAARFFVHKLRAKCDAIIVGKNTVKADNPSLSVRFSDFQKYNNGFIENDYLTGYDNLFIKYLFNKNIDKYKDPLRVVIGIPDNIDTSLNVFCDDNYIIYERKDKYLSLEKKIDFDLSKYKIKIFTENGLEFINKIMDDLANKGIMIVLLEGGSKVAGAFFDSGNIDQVISFITPKVVSSGIPILNGTGVATMNKAKYLNDISMYKVDSDILYTGYYK